MIKRIFFYLVGFTPLIIFLVSPPIAQQVFAYASAVPICLALGGALLESLGLDQ